MSAWTYRRLTVRPPNRLFRLILEPHDGRALVPIPKRSASLRATSTQQRWIVSKRLTQAGRLEKRTCAVQEAMSAKGQKRTSASKFPTRYDATREPIWV